MTETAREALADLVIAIERLKKVTDPTHWRIDFIGCMAIASAVGDVLTKVDKNKHKNDPCWCAAYDDLIEFLASQPRPNAYLDFINKHRNAICHQYEVKAGLEPSVVFKVTGKVVVAEGDAIVLERAIVDGIEVQQFPRISAGAFAGHDPIELLEHIADWWSVSLDTLDATAAKVRAAISDEHK